MIAPRKLLLTLATLTAAGCQPQASAPTDQDAAAAKSTDTQSAKADAVTPPEQPSEQASEAKPDKPDKPQPPKPTNDEAEQLHRKLIVLLNEGRALTKQGDYAGGIAKYRAALDIDASDPTVLGELGWAAYKSGDLELAHRTTVTALKFVRKDNSRGMMLYNLGRIEEDRGNQDAAVEHYKASLVARPGHKVVQERVEKLLAATPEQAPKREAVVETPYTPLPILATGLTDLAAVCHKLTADSCEDFSMSVDDTCSCEAKLDAAPGADQSWGLVLFANNDSPMQRAWFPVVQTDAGWTLFEFVLYEYNPGAFGIYEEAAVASVTVEPLLATGTQLVIALGKSRMDRDMGLNEIEDETHATTVICARHAAGASCTRPLYREYRYRREIEFEDFEVEGEALDHSDGLPIDTGFAASFEFVGGELVVSWTETRGGYAQSGEIWESHGWLLGAGKYALAMLLGIS